MMAAPRRVCPACLRRYAGLVAAECPVCQGMGILALGAAALHHHEAPAVARAVDLYLEHAAQEAQRTLSLGDQRAALEAATDELRVAGVLATSSETYTRPLRHTSAEAEAQSVLELDADQIVRELARPANGEIRRMLVLAPVDDLEPYRPRLGGVPTASRNGHLTAVAVIADPIDPIGPDVAHLAQQDQEHTYQGRVLAGAVPRAAALRHQREQADLDRYRLDDLKRAARAAGLPISSNKRILVSRLREHGQLTPTG